jgi:hypothetical protein
MRAIVTCFSVVLALLLLGTHPAAAANEWVTCDPVNVATFANRVHVKCAASIGGVQWFAQSSDDEAETARIMSTLLVAQVAGRTLTIFTDLSDTSGASFGCQASDCRLINGLAMWQ